MAILVIIILVYAVLYLLFVVTAGLLSWFIDIIKESKESDSKR